MIIEISLLTISLYSEQPVSSSFATASERRLGQDKLQYGLEGQRSLECSDIVCPAPVLAQIN